MKHRNRDRDQGLTPMDEALLMEDWARAADLQFAQLLRIHYHREGTRGRIRETNDPDLTAAFDLGGVILDRALRQYGLTIDELLTSPDEAKAVMRAKYAEWGKA